MREVLPHAYCRILELYLMDRTPSSKIQRRNHNLKKSEAGVPEASVLGAVLYLIYKRDLATSQQKTVIFADDTAVLDPHENGLNEIPSHHQ
jgi:hypothetical protein